MKKLTKDFFGESVLMVGYSRDEKSFSRMVYKELVANGIKVVPVNPNKDETYDIKVYTSVNEVDDVPDTAYVIVSKGNAYEALRMLGGTGVKRVLLQSKSYVDQDIDNYCQSNGIEIYVGCPFMAVGKGLHRFHGFLAGVK